MCLLSWVKRRLAWSWKMQFLDIIPTEGSDKRRESSLAASESLIDVRKLKNMLDIYFLASLYFFMFFFCFWLLRTHTVRPQWRMSTLHEITRWCQHKYCDFISAIKINLLIQVLHQSIKLTHLHFGSVHVMFVVGLDSNLKFTTCAICLRFSTWQVKNIRNLHHDVQVKFFCINSRKLIL